MTGYDSGGGTEDEDGAMPKRAMATKLEDRVAGGPSPLHGIATTRTIKPHFQSLSKIMKDNYCSRVKARRRLDACPANAQHVN